MRIGQAVVLLCVLAGCRAPDHDGHGAAADGKSAEDALGTAGAHEHGVARVNVAVENTTITIEFFAPGASIFGFEGEADTPERQRQRDAGLERLRTGITSMFQLEASLGCVAAEPAVAIEETEHHEAEKDSAGSTDHEQEQHGEVHAEIEFRCARSPAGSTLKLAITERFPEIGKADLQVLSDARQAGARVNASGYVVKL
jgi:hypothetical protein